MSIMWNTTLANAAAAAKSLQSCPTLCDPIDGSAPGSPVPGILQARTLEWVAIAFSNAWKWKVKVKSLSCSDVSDPQRPQGLQPTRHHHPWDIPGNSFGVGCQCWPSLIPFSILLEWILTSSLVSWKRHRAKRKASCHYYPSA